MSQQDVTTEFLPFAAPKRGKLVLVGRGDGIAEVVKREMHPKNNGHTHTHGQHNTANQPIVVSKQGRKEGRKASDKIQGHLFEKNGKRSTELQEAGLLSFPDSPRSLVTTITDRQSAAEQSKD